MADSTQRRRFISPAGLFLVLLCFFLPFFSVSCSSGFGELSVTATGMDQVFNGRPDYSGYQPTAARTRDAEVGVSPLLVIALVAIVAGIGLGLGLPKPLARWAAGAGASLLALLLIVVNQIALHSRVNQELDTAAEGLGDNPFAASFRPMITVSDGAGFWIAVVLLLALVGYNVVEVAWQRSPNRRPRFLAGGASSQSPYPSGGRPAPPPPGQAPPGQWYPPGTTPRQPFPPGQWYPPAPGTRDPQ